MVILPTKAREILAEVYLKGKMSTVMKIPEELRRVVTDVRKEETGDAGEDLEGAKHVIRSKEVGEEEKEIII